MESMIFTTDRTSLTEGEVIEIRWDCTEAERAELTIDNGYKATAITLETAGSKRFRLNRSKGKTRLTMTAWVGGKSYSKTIKVTVREMPVTHAEAVDGKGRSLGSLGEWWQQRAVPKWRAAKARWSANWSAMPEGKRMAAKILIIMAALMLLTAPVPRLFPLALVGLMIYLVIVITKR